MPTNYKKLFAIQKQNEEIINQQNPLINTKSGIYLFFRTNEDNEKCCYVGQAKNLLRRTAQHLSGRKLHIDLSLFKHKWFNENNPTGWQLTILEFCKQEDLDKQEQYYIDKYIDLGYKVYNITGGGQLNKKQDINKRNQIKLKSYANGKQFGYEKARKEIVLLFTKYLKFDVKKDNILNQRAKEKFEKFLKGANENGNKMDS